MRIGRLRNWASESSVIYHAFEGRPEPVQPLVALRKAAIYRQYPNQNQDDPQVPLFPKLSFSLDSDKASSERWAVISHGASPVRTNFLHTLRGQYSCVPPAARVWPHLASLEAPGEQSLSPRDPSQAVQYVGFGNQGAGAGSTGTQGAYLGARYESRKESTDWSLLDYLRGTVSLNLSEEEASKAAQLQSDPAFQKVVQDFKLENLLVLPVGNLSNGQTRRARIAKSILKRPELLLLDEPFAGLDPVNCRLLSGLLASLAEQSEPRMVLALPPVEVPDWITHVIHLNTDGTVQAIGDKLDVYQADKTLVFMKHIFPKPEYRRYKFSDPDKQEKKERLREKMHGKVTKHQDRLHKSWPEVDQRLWIQKRDPAFPFWDQPEYLAPDQESSEKSTLVEMKGVQVRYGDKCVLGDWQQDVDGERKSGLHWEVKPGDRWAVFGPNGSGKTTLISLLTSDHPQAYSLPMKVFGRHRLPLPGQPGLSVFDLQSRIGHSSPEVHTYFPKHLSVRQTIENAWADAFHSKPNLTHETDDMVDAALRWFQKELDPACASQEDILDHWWRDRTRRRQREEGLRKRRAGEHVGKPQLIRSFSEWIESYTNWADSTKFSDLSLSGQRVALFLRAVIKKPDIVVLDEAFSGMDELSRRKCMLWLAHGDQRWLAAPYIWSGSHHVKIDTGLTAFGLSKISGLEPRQALICISHRQEELPFVVDKWLRLPEANEGKSAVFGTIDRSPGWWAKDYWSEIWNREK